MNKKHLLVLSTALSISYLMACGSGNKQNDYYEKEVRNLYEDIITVDSCMNNIDFNNDYYIDEFFDSLDKLEEAISDFSLVDAPSQYDNCEILAKKSLEFLNLSENDFHKALDNEYDSIAFNNAKNNYNEAIKCINYIGMVLEGKELLFSE